MIHYNRASFQDLTEDQAAEKLSKFGLNELPQSKKENFWVRSAKLLKEPMLLLLILGCSVYLIMGDLTDGLMLGSFVFVVLGISIYQEHKSSRALDALRELSSPRALVLRNGIQKRIPATQLVPGDLIVLREGDRVPADGVIFQSTNLSIDESLLTGESFPAKKIQLEKEIVDQPTESLENQFKVFSSTLVVTGTALARVLKTGIDTEVGKIGKSLQEIVPEELNLTKEIRQVVRLLAWTGSIISLSIILLFGFAHNDWLQAFLLGLATELSLLPEELPVVLTIFLALGAWRLSKVQVLIRRPASIERLGAVTVLCVDKTGTLTQNQMTVAAINNSLSTREINSEIANDLEEDFHGVAEFGVLSSHRDPFDPMEKAIRRMVEEGKWGIDHLHRDWELVRDYPLSNKLLAMSCVWKDPRSDSYVIAAKGAPEAILDLCHIEQSRALQISSSIIEMAGRGLRVLGVARATFSKQQLPSNQHEFEFQWLGLIGLEDPLRPEVPSAVERCRTAGIRVIMMTGDYPETALKVAHRAGIDTVNALITGAEVSSLSDQELTERLKSAHIFARMIPEQKLRIVKILKAMGHVVAMTGDGVNDAPSLKWADVGIAMGSRGTDVAREASDIVLTDDNFASIVSGVERGRLIFINIKKTMSYIVSIHVPIAGLAIFPVIFNWPIILMPVHIVFLQLVIDPACSLLFESQTSEEGVMRLKPRPLNKRLFSFKDLLHSTLQGVLVFSVVTVVLLFSFHINKETPERTRTFAFTVLAMSNLGLIFASMSNGSIHQMARIFNKRSNWFVVLAVTLGLIIITQISEVRSLFHFGYLQPIEFVTSIGISMLLFIFISLWNWVLMKRIRPAPVNII